MAKIFQGLGPKRRECCNGDRVYTIPYYTIPYYTITITITIPILYYNILYHYYYRHRIMPYQSILTIRIGGLRPVRLLRKSSGFKGFDASRLLILRDDNSHVLWILQGVSRKVWLKDSSRKTLDRWTGHMHRWSNNHWPTSHTFPRDEDITTIFKHTTTFAVFSFWNVGCWNGSKTRTWTASPYAEAKEGCILREPENHYHKWTTTTVSC